MRREIDDELLFRRRLCPIELLTQVMSTFCGQANRENELKRWTLRPYVMLNRSIEDGRLRVIY